MDNGGIKITVVGAVAIVGAIVVAILIIRFIQDHHRTKGRILRNIKQQDIEFT